MLYSYLFNVVDMHFDRNRTHRRNSRLGVKMAHTIAEEERRAFVTKQLDYYQQKKQMFV